MYQKFDFITKELIDKAVIEIDKKGIPSGRNGTKYAFNIRGKNYPYKLLITEAAKLENIDLKAEDFSSNAQYRINLEQITGYPLIELNKKMIFKNLGELVDTINTTLGNFCSEFQYKRKELLKMGSATNRDKLFIISDKERDWVINPGGGTEIQYHLFLRNKKVSYGIGFNTQYVPFANKKSPIEYIQPYVDSFLSKSEFLKTLLENDFNFIIGDESKLRKLEHDDYILIGKEIDVTDYEGVFEMESSLFNQMIIDLKEILFETYKTVLSNMNTQKKIDEEISENVKILIAKKQIILQGPPGTGKTYTAKDIAEQMIYGGVSADKKKQALNLNNSDQFVLIQFHPSYTYEDFVRGIIVESNEGKVTYRTKNKSLGEFAEMALENYNLSRKDNTEANIKKWVDEKFDEFKNEIEVQIEENEIELSGNVTIFEVCANSFKYGKNWKISSHLNFQEIKALIKAVVENKLTISNQQISKDISVHAHYRYTYYNSLLSLFFEKYEYKIEATKTDEKKYVLIIDEINRANLPSVLGELIYALEYRGQFVDSIYKLDDGGSKITLPENLFIIGTMNTADRSVGHIDYAIKRRFAFVDVLPNQNVIKNEKAKEIFNLVEKLFCDEFLASDFEKNDVQLGHSYFILKEGTEEEQEEELQMRLKYEIVPILKEYVKDGLLLENARKEITKIAEFV